MFELINSNEIDKRASNLKRQCGECTLCCELLKIEELNKPTRMICPHATEKHGCSIYPKRPHSCRQFSCQWLINPSLAEYWYPKKSGLVVFYSNEKNSYTLNVHAINYEAWQAPLYYGQIKALAITGLEQNKEGNPRRDDEQFFYKVVVNDGCNRYLILPQRDVIISNKYYALLFNYIIRMWEIKLFDTQTEAEEFMK